MQALDSEVIRVFGLNAPDEVFARHGVQHPLGAGFAGAQDLLPHGMDEQTALSHAAAIPPVGDAGISPLCGTPDEVIDQAAEWRDCGVRYMVLSNLSLLQRSLRKGLASAQSVQTRSCQGLKKL